MSDSHGWSIKGMQDAQRWNLRAIAAVKPGGRLSSSIRTILVQLQRYEVTITHVDTGSLRASLRIELNGLRGRIFIDENSINPKTGQPPSIYGVIENARGSAHAFGARTVNEAAPQIVGTALSYLGRGMQ